MEPLPEGFDAWPAHRQCRWLWVQEARPSQLTPLGLWNIWLILAGRGYGKTRAGAEDVANFGCTHPKSRIALVAATFPDARDTMVEGESGLLSVLPAGMLDKWNRSIGELVLVNGTIYRLYSAEKPDRLRGPQHHRAWCDELAAWLPRPNETFDMLMMGMRLGDHPQVIVTTTPKPLTLIRETVVRPDAVVTRGSTYENVANLPSAFVAQIRSRYEGTRLGRQELLAEILDDVPGAYWTRKAIEDHRKTDHPNLIRIVVAIDPAVTTGEDSDETGMAVVGLGSDMRFYVLADASSRDKHPMEWAQLAVNLYHEHKADRIIGEINNGGEMIEALIRTVDPNVSYRAVTATRGKRVRAEPIAALYEQGRVSHVGTFATLEDQMCMWVPDQVDWSPDRVDALVWALTELAEGSSALAYLNQISWTCVECSMVNRLSDVACARCKAARVGAA